MTMAQHRHRSPASTPDILVPAIGDGLRASSTRAQLVRNPVMFVVDGRRGADHRPVPARPRDRRGRPRLLRSRSSLWLWFTVLFANFAEAMAEGRGKAQAASLRRTQDRDRRPSCCIGDDRTEYRLVPGTSARRSATSCWSRPATSSPSDGEVIEGVASVNEAAITGESAPVIREAGGDRSAVTGGTQRALRLDQGAHHRRAGLDLPRPHDRAGRGRRAPEDAERDRAQHPARRPDAHLPLRGRRPSRASPPMPAARSR